MPVETSGPGPASGVASIELRLLGWLSIRRDGVELELPHSRKARALVAYLALAPHALSRSHLCELLWDGPNDPRGELRWCLSKVRALVDVPGRRRIETQSDTVRLDLADCRVDALELARSAPNVATLEVDRLRALVALCAGDLLEGLEIDRSPAFTAWLTAQRRRFCGWRTALLERLVASEPDEDALGYLDRWLELAPFDVRAHELLLRRLAQCGRIDEAETHLAATMRRFELESLDSAPVREAWRVTRSMRHQPRPGTGPASVVAAGPEGAFPTAARRASIAVMPFVDPSTGTGMRGGVADALAHDVITRLAKLRVLFVIAQGTMFALDERRVGPSEAGRMLDVDYVVSGAVRHHGGRLTVMAELAEARTAHVVWAETFSYRQHDTFLVLDEISNRIVASVASEIETSERNRAVLRPPSSLDAWGAHHRGLWHMYRFNQADNELARHYFERAVHLDPTFSRAHAGLSFTHFQSAFQGWARRDKAVDRAFAAAGQSLIVDDRDPAAHWAMGRALWLRGSYDQSLVELEQAVDLSPNFALGHYTLAFVHSQSGDALAAIAAADHSRQLSPFDPLLFGMLGARAMALVRLGRLDEAADWGIKAAARPNAHAHILAIAAFSLALAGRLDEARTHLASIHATLPGYRVQDFLTAMQFGPDGEKLFRKGAEIMGIE